MCTSPNAIKNFGWFLRFFRKGSVKKWGVELIMTLRKFYPIVCYVEWSEVTLMMSCRKAILFSFLLITRKKSAKWVLYGYGFSQPVSGMFLSLGMNFFSSFFSLSLSLSLSHTHTHTHTHSFFSTLTFVAEFKICTLRTSFEVLKYFWSKWEGLKIYKRSNFPFFFSYHFHN
jgi:hypothetical protein